MLWEKNVSHKIQVGRANILTSKEIKEEEENKKHSADIDIRKLFIGGLPGLTSFSEFKKYFSRFGALEDIMLPMKSKESKLNSGFGFVTFKNAKDALAVLQSKNQHSFRAKLVL